MFYHLGKKIDLKRNYKLVAANLFVGGVVGNSSPCFVLSVLVTGSQWESSFPDILSFVFTILAFLLFLVGFGLGMVFSGFFALTVAYFRQKEPKTPASGAS